MTTERRNPLKPNHVEVAGHLDLPGSTYTPGYCPECQKAMAVTTADGIPTYVCIEHRISLPVEHAE